MSSKHLQCLLLIFMTIQLSGQSKINLISVANGFSSPVDIANAGDDRLFVVERAGVIRIISDVDNGTVLSTAFLDIRDLVEASSGEQGLLGLAFHPNYQTNGKFYVNYIRDSGSNMDITVIQEFEVSAMDPNIANGMSARTIMEFEQDFTNHNGGDLNFGPDDYLYIASGDGGSGNDPNNRGQDNSQLLGKILRIDINIDDFPDDDVNNYGVPSSNPGVRDLGYHDAIWATGLRNPWRFSFDRETGDMWIADVGQSGYEEVNFQPASSIGGENYGWRCCEGLHDNPSMSINCCGSLSNKTDPIFEVPHSGTSDCSITGGFVYRGDIQDQLRGFYICADFCSQNIYAIQAQSKKLVHTESTSSGNITTFGEGADGELYMATTAGGIYHVTDNNIALPIDLMRFSAERVKSGIKLEWLASLSSGFLKFVVERSADGASFHPIAEIPFSVNDEGTRTFEFIDVEPNRGKNFYRIKMVEQGQLEMLSKIILTDFDSNLSNVAVEFKNGNIEITNIEDFGRGSIQINIVDFSGRQILKRTFNNDESNKKVHIDLGTVHSGIYLVEIEGLTYRTTKRIFVN